MVPELCESLGVDCVVYYDLEFVYRKHVSRSVGYSLNYYHTPFDALFHKTRLAISLNVSAIDKEGSLSTSRHFYL